MEASEVDSTGEEQIQMQSWKNSLNSEIMEKHQRISRKGMSANREGMGRNGTEITHNKEQTQNK